MTSDRYFKLYENRWYFRIWVNWSTTIIFFFIIFDDIIGMISSKYLASNCWEAVAGIFIKLQVYNIHCTICIEIKGRWVRINMALNWLTTSQLSYKHLIASLRYQNSWQLPSIYKWRQAVKGIIFTCSTHWTNASTWQHVLEYSIQSKTRL